MIPWNHMLLNSEWHVYLTYFLKKSDKKMMDSNLKKSYEHWKKTKKCKFCRNLLVISLKSQEKQSVLFSHKKR